MIRKAKFPHLPFIIACVLVLSACGSAESAEPTLDMNAVFTQVAATIEMEYTQTALAMPTATNTPEPTATLTASPTVPPPTLNTTPTVVAAPILSGATAYPTISSTANGCYDAALVSETIPAGTKYDPGNNFEKVWRVTNTGTCDWTNDFKITFVGGDLFGSDTTKIRGRVPIGNSTEIRLSMVAPASSGTVVSNWKLATDTGEFFGPLLSVSIKLPGSNTTASGCYDAALVSDVTIPDGTEVNSGASFRKTWEVKNTGTCDWNNDFKITFVGGDLFGSDTTKIRKTVYAGSNANISLDMVAPSGTGTVTSSWQMADDSGNLFGQIYTVEIVLK